MFSSSDIEIDLPPIIAGFPAAECISIFGIHVTQKIPAAPCISWHGIDLSCTTFECCPLRKVRQRALCIRTGPKVCHGRKLNRQCGGRERNSHLIFPNDGKWFAPIALAAESGIAHFVIGMALADPQSF